MSQLASSAVIIGFCSYFIIEAQSFQTLVGLDLIHETYVKLWGIACLMKFGRMVAVLSRIKQIGLTLEVFYNVLPFLSNLFGMTMIIFFVFATVGINIFGGNITNHTPAFYQQKVGSPLPDGYQYLNFNDFPNAILTLYVNVINNNWMFVTNMLILSEDDSKVQQKWFFVFFQLIVNYFIMSILVGFVIDNIMVSFDLNKTEEEKRKIIGNFFPRLNLRN